MAATRIALDADTLLSHVAKLNAAADGLPAGEHVVSSVQGNSTVEAEQKFHSWLSDSAGKLGRASDSLHRNLAKNSAALKQAAETLLQRNQISADQAQSFLTLLGDSTAAAKAPTTDGGSLGEQAGAKLDAGKAPATPPATTPPATTTPGYGQQSAGRL